MAGNGVNVGHGNISISPVLERGFAQRIRQELQSRLNGVQVEIGASLSRASIAHIHQQLAGNITIDVDARLSQQSIQHIRSQLAGLAGGVVIDARLDRTSLARIQQQLNGLSGTARVNVNSSGANSGIGNTTRSLNIFSSTGVRSAARVSAAFGGIGVAVAAVGAAIGPLVGLLGGLGAAGLVAGAGFAALGALAIPQVKAISDGVKAVDKANTATAKSTTGIVAAQRNLASTQRNIAQQRISDAESIQKAQQQLADAEMSAAQQQISDARAVAQATENLTRAQQAVNEARRQAVIDLRNLRNEQDTNRLSVQQAELDLQQTQLDTAKTLGGTVDPAKQEAVTKAQARLNLQQAQQRVKDAKTTAADSAAAFADASKKGINGSAGVVSALQQERDARQAVTDAQSTQRDNAVQSARAIKDASQGIADAQRQAANNQLDAADQLQSAYEAITSAIDSVNKANDDQAAALAKLTPAQRAAVDATVKLKEAFKAQSDAISGPFLDAYVAGTKTAIGLLPTLGKLATSTGNALKGVFDRATTGLTAATGPNGGLTQFIGIVQRQIGPVLDRFATIFTNVGRSILGFMKAAEPIIQPALDVFVRLTQSLAGAANGAGLVNFFKQIQPLLVPLEQTLKSLGGLFANLIAGTLPLAGPVLGFIKTLADALSALFRSADFNIFIGAIGKALTALEPALRALVAPLGQFFAIFGRIVAQLAPIVGPIIVTLAQAFADLLTALAPLFPALAQVVGVLVDALAPVIQPLAAAFTDALMPILQALADLLVAIAPSFQAVVAAFAPLLPLVGQLFAALGPLIAQLVSAFAPVLAALLQALQPIIPALAQIVTTLGQAFVDALLVLLPALIPLLDPLGRLVIALLDFFLAAVQPFLPLLTVFAQLLAALVPVLVPLINAFVWLVNVMRPMAPVLLAMISPFLLVAGVIYLWVKAFQFAWNVVIFPLLRLAGQLFQWLWTNAAQPALGAIGAAFGAMGAALGWVWNTVIHPVFNFFIDVLKVLGFIFLAIVAVAIVAAWEVMSRTFAFLWDTVIHPVFNAFAATVQWLWNNVLRPAFGQIGWSWGLLTSGMRWAWDNVLHPAWNAIAATAGWLWNNVLKPIFHGIGVGWDGLLRGMSWVWDHVLRPTFDGIRYALGILTGAFQGAVDGIRHIWGGLEEVFRKPIRAVIGIVAGFDTAVNDITDKVGLGRPLPQADKLPHFQTGGVIPGPVTAQRDNVLGVDRFGVPTARVEPGEFIVNRDVTARALPLLQALNAGSLPAFAGGGFLGVVKHVASAVTPDFVGNAVHAGTKALGDAASWALEGAAGFLRSGAADAVDALYKTISSPVFGLIPPGLGGDIGKHAADDAAAKVVEWIRGKEMSDMMLGTDGIAYNGGSNTVGLIEGLARSLPGGNAMKVTSTTGGTHASGSYHGRGQAVDFSNGFGNTAQMLAFDQAWAAKYGGSLAELIYTAPGSVFVKNGAAVPPSFYSGVLDQHRNHVHVAISPESIARGKQGLGSQRFAGGGPAGETRPVGAWRGVVLQALGLNGLPASLADKVLRQIGSESGGNPNQLQTVRDINSGPNAARGLMQVIPTTFRAYHLPGTSGNILDPLSNVAAALNYAKHRYGPGLSALGQGHGYDSGGYLMPGVTMAMNATGKPEPVFTAGQWDTLSSLVGGGSGGRSGPLIETAHIREEADAALVARKLAWLDKLEGASV